MSKTLQHLLAAFAGESQANRKYLAFAKKADEEGFHQAARLFRAAAEAETVHALNHFKAMQGIKSTRENLEAAISGENYEAISMYPPMLAEAEASSEKKAATSFKWALEVEKEHEALYRSALECLEAPAEEYDFYVCPVCGHTHPRNAPDKCPVCSTPGARFFKVS